MKKLAIAFLVIAFLPTHLSAAADNSVRLVVQQNGQTLVNEVRSLTIPKGVGSVTLLDLPATIDAQTLQVHSKTSPKELNIQDLSLDDELLSPSTMLRRFIGKKVNLVLPDGKSRDGRIQKEALVLSTDESPLFLIDGQVYSGPVDAIIYPEVPQGLGSRPRLALNVANNGPVRQSLDLSYMAREISWRMDYVLTLNKAATSGLLSGWVTLANRSGKSFDQASIELLAGEPRSVRPPLMRTYMADAAPMAKLANAGVESEPMFEYHIYHLKRPINLANQQSRQVQLFKSATIPVARKLLGRAAALPSGRETDPQQQKLEVVLSFRNTGAQGLGLPLPKGTLRTLQEDGEARHFLGETQVERAAAGATVELRLGQVFDVNVERVVTQYEKTGKNSYRAAWELRIRNAKKEPQRITLQEQIPGKWKVEDASRKWDKPLAGVLEFTLDVPPTGDGDPLVLKYSFTTEL
jgi:Uncharacterized conserved protein